MNETRSARLFWRWLAIVAPALFTHAHAFVYDDDPNALLGSSRGGLHIWDYCYDKPDHTPVPEDPRTLVQPGTNAGRAVHFNAFWVDCHVDPAAVREVGTPKTCGALRDQ